MDRTKGIGGSDVSVLFGCNPYRTLRELYDEKVGASNGDVDSRILARGRAYEPVIADLFVEETGLSVRRVNEPYVHKKHPFILGHVDRRISEFKETKRAELAPMANKGAGILEIKCIGVWNFRKMQLNGVFQQYQLQMQHYLMLSGLKWGVFCIHSPEKFENIYVVVESDPFVQNEIVEKCVDFWKHVEAKTPPSETTTSSMVELPPIGGKEIVDLSSNEEFDKALKDYMEGKRIVDEGESIKENASERMKAIIGEKEIAEARGARIYYSNESRKSFNKAKLLKEHPEIKEEDYTSLTKYRALKVFAKKESES